MKNETARKVGKSMKRQILFRGKRIDNGEWEGGYYAKFGYTEKERSYIIPVYASALYAIEIDPATIGQYVGLKDKNGRKIWENDICEMVYDGVSHTYLIVWDEGELDFKGTNGKKKYGGNFEYLTCCEEIEVIGNIFDNPELLEQIVK